MGQRMRAPFVDYFLGGGSSLSSAAGFRAVPGSRWSFGARASADSPVEGSYWWGGGPGAGSGSDELSSGGDGLGGFCSSPLSPVGFGGLFCGRSGLWGLGRLVSGASVCFFLGLPGRAGRFVAEVSSRLAGAARTGLGSAESVSRSGVRPGSDRAGQSLPADGVGGPMRGASQKRASELPETAPPFDRIHSNSG